MLAVFPSRAPIVEFNLGWIGGNLSNLNNLYHCMGKSNRALYTNNERHVTFQNLQGLIVVVWWKLIRSLILVCGDLPTFINLDDLT